MRKVHANYKGRNLTATEQQHGGWRVVLEGVAEGEGFSTETHETLEDAMVAARQMIDKSASARTDP